MWKDETDMCVHKRLSYRGHQPGGRRQNLAVDKIEDMIY